ncbi:MAG TPA: transporter [Chthoniobacterales bacterium]
MKKRLISSLAVLCLGATGVLAEEGGSGQHVPGAYGSFSGIVPDKPGFTVKNSIWGYGGDAARADTFERTVSLAVGPKAKASALAILAAGATGRINLNPDTAARLMEILRLEERDINISGVSKFSLSSDVWFEAFSLVYTMPWEIAGGHLSSAVFVPFLWLETTADVELRINDRQRQRTVKESNFGLSDIVVSPYIIGWEKGYFHWMTGLNVYVPTGDYSPTSLAPLGKNHWSFEPNAGITYLNLKTGLEISGATGLVFSTENSDTDYGNGIVWFLEYAVTQHLPGGLGVGVAGNVYDQITGDNGSGANGGFHSRSIGVGPILQYAGKIGGRDISSDVKWLHEVDTKNRISGDMIWLNFAIAL